MSAENISKSVHQRLLNIRNATGEQFDHLLIRYGLERLLYRIQVADAIRATFDRRNVALPEELPIAFTPGFLEDGTKETQWQAFLRRSSLSSFGLDLATVLADLKERLAPLLSAARDRG